MTRRGKRGHWPDATDDQLRNRAIELRAERYAKGRWPTDEEIEAEKAKEEAPAEPATAPGGPGNPNEAKGALIK